MRPPLISSSVASGLALTCLLLSGCASEKALQTQTQPLQDQIALLEQKVATSGEASARNAQSQADSLAARQTDLEKKLASLQAGIESLQSQLQARDAQGAQVASRLDALSASLANRIDAIEKNLNETADLANKTALQIAGLQDRQNAANNALASRLNLAEQQLKSVSNLVQEALAASAKEIFLANGKEAFTVMLTEDKVLYPQNDPNLDHRDAAKLDELADKLVKLDQEYHLDIQGHTANTSTDDNNYSLGKARAEVAKRYLHEKKGISISRMSTISYGANKPLSPAGGSNRRIFIRVLVLK